jgi:hypothetical protein
MDEPMLHRDLIAVITISVSSVVSAMKSTRLLEDALRMKSGAYYPAL